MYGTQIHSQKQEKLNIILLSEICEEVKEFEGDENGNVWEEWIENDKIQLGKSKFPNCKKVKMKNMVLLLNN